MNTVLKNEAFENIVSKNIVSNSIASKSVESRFDSSAFKPVHPDWREVTYRTGPAMGGGLICGERTGSTGRFAAIGLNSAHLERARRVMRKSDDRQRKILSSTPVR